MNKIQEMLDTLDNLDDKMVGQKFKHKDKDFEVLTSAGFNARGAAARGGKMGTHFWARDMETGKRVLMHSNVLDDGTVPYYVNQIVRYKDKVGHEYRLELKEVSANEDGTSIKYKALVVEGPEGKSGTTINLTQADHPAMERFS